MKLLTQLLYVVAEVLYEHYHGPIQTVPSAPYQWWPTYPPAGGTADPYTWPTTITYEVTS